MPPQASLIPFLRLCSIGIVLANWISILHLNALIKEMNFGDHKISAGSPNCLISEMEFAFYQPMYGSQWQFPWTKMESQRQPCTITLVLVHNSNLHTSILVRMNCACSPFARNDNSFLVTASPIVILAETVMKLKQGGTSSKGRRKKAHFS